MDPLTITLIVIVAVILCIYYYRQLVNWIVQQKKLTWPIKIENCPDYWNETKGGMCENVINLDTSDCGAGSKPLKQFKFNSEVFKGPEGNKQKCNWSKKCKTSWEGIDNLCA